MGEIAQFRCRFPTQFSTLQVQRHLLKALERFWEHTLVAMSKRCGHNMSILCSGKICSTTFMRKCCWTNCDRFWFNIIFQQCLLQVTSAAFGFCFRIIRVYTSIFSKTKHTNSIISTLRRCYHTVFLLVCSLRLFLCVTTKPKKNSMKCVVNWIPLSFCVCWRHTEILNSSLNLWKEFSNLKIGLQIKQAVLSKRCQHYFLNLWQKKCCWKVEFQGEGRGNTNGKDIRTSWNNTERTKAQTCCFWIIQPIILVKLIL